MNKKIMFLLCFCIFYLSIASANNATHFDSLSDTEQAEQFEALNEEERNDLFKSYENLINNGESKEAQKEGIEKLEFMLDNVYAIDAELNLDNLQHEDGENKKELSYKDNSLIIKSGEGENEQESIIPLENIPDSIQEITYREKTNNVKGAAVAYKDDNNNKLFLSSGVLQKNENGEMTLKEDNEVIGKITLSSKDGLFLRGTPVALEGSNAVFEKGNYVWGKNPGDITFEKNGVTITPSTNDNPAPNNKELYSAFYLEKDGGFVSRGIVEKENLKVEVLNQNDLTFYLDGNKGNAQNQLTITNNDDGITVSSSGKIRNAHISANDNSQITFNDQKNNAVAYGEGGLKLVWSEDMQNQNIFAGRTSQVGFSQSQGSQATTSNVNPYKFSQKDVDLSNIKSGDYSLDPSIEKKIRDASVSLQVRTDKSGQPLPENPNLAYGDVTGSGTHIGSGYILTAAHNIEGSKSIKVTDVNGISYEAKIIDQILDRSNDLDVAILRVSQGQNIPFIPVYDKNLAIGEFVTMAGFFSAGTKYGSSGGKVLPDGSAFAKFTRVSVPSQKGQSGGGVIINTDKGLRVVSPIRGNLGDLESTPEIEPGSTGFFTRNYITRDLLKANNLDHLIQETTP